MCVFLYSSAAFVLPLAPRFLPLFLPPSSPSLHQLPEELSVWIAALSVQPVRLRDAFWSAVDTDRPVRWDDSCKWRRAQTGTCNVTRLLHPSTTTTIPSCFPSPPPLPKNKYPCIGSWRVEGNFSFEPERMWCSHVMKGISLVCYHVNLLCYFCTLSAWN